MDAYATLTHDPQTRHADGAVSRTGPVALAPKDPFAHELSRVLTTTETPLAVLRLAVGGSGGQDRWEREADRVADSVDTGEKSWPAPGSPRRPVDSDHAGGAPLAPGLRAGMEARLGRRFDGVRVHTGPRAAASAEAAGAHAYTVGEHIVFGRDQYAPHRPEGRRLIAHELAHVVQQRDGSVPRARVQRKIVLTGTAANLARTVAIMNAGLGPTLEARLSSTGEVEIRSSGGHGPPSLQQQAFTTRLQSLVSESGTTTVSVAAGTATIVGSYATGEIDIADIEQLGMGDVGWDSRAALLHELVEQREKQLGATAAQRAYGSATTGAHSQGLAAELGVIGAVLESDSGLVGATANPDGTMNGTRTVVFKYPDGTRYRVEVTLDHNNITGVTRTKLP